MPASIENAGSLVANTEGLGIRIEVCQGAKKSSGCIVQYMYSTSLVGYVLPYVNSQAISDPK